MIALLKRSSKFAVGFASAIITIVPEELFKIFSLIPEDILAKIDKLDKYVADINVILNRILLFVIIWVIATAMYKVYLIYRKKVIIKGKNYEITIEHGDLLKTKKCKRVISFDECFSTNIGEKPEDIKPTSICGQYLTRVGDLDIQSLILSSGIKPSKTKSKYKNQDKYESGCIVPNGDDLLMSFVKLDKNGVGKMTRKEYLKCLENLWEELDKHYAQKDICIPILGAGITRFSEGNGASIPKEELLDIIICSYKLSSYKIKDPCKLRIICDKDISLENVGKNI